MKAIDLSKSSPTLADVLELASEDNLVLRTVDGREFVLAEIDDFADEVARVRQNEALMQLLKARSSEQATFSLSQVRKELRKAKAQKTPRNKR